MSGMADSRTALSLTVAEQEHEIGSLRAALEKERADNAALVAKVELLNTLLKQRDAENAETLAEAVKIEDERNTLRRDNAALRADKERLDWMASQYWKFREETSDTVAFRRYTLCMPPGVVECPVDLRAAIDAARAALAAGGAK